MKPTILLACAGLLGFVFLPALRANIENQQTEITFNGPVEVPGTVLSAGTYTFKLLNNAGDRHLVEIANAAGTEPITTVMTIPDRRLHSIGKTVIKFEKPRAAGSPEALKAWFYPGARTGEEFVYPKERAQELAKANGDPVFTPSDSNNPLPEK